MKVAENKKPPVKGAKVGGKNLEALNVQTLQEWREKLHDMGYCQSCAEWLMPGSSMEEHQHSEGHLLNKLAR